MNKNITSYGVKEILNSLKREFPNLKLFVNDYQDEENCFDFIVNWKSSDEKEYKKLLKKFIAISKKYDNVSYGAVKID